MITDIEIAQQCKMQPITEIAKKLVNDKRINFLCRSDYSKGKDVEKAVKLILRKVHINNEIDEAIEEQSKRLK